MSHLIALLIMATLSLAQTTADIYWFFDDGGEHPYLKTCAKISETSKDFQDVKKKLKGADNSRGYLGSYSFEIEDIGSYSAQYYRNEKLCNENLKKKRAWLEPEKKK